MPKLPWMLILRVAALVALAASAALLSDYGSDAPSFCSAASGCGAIKRSVYSQIQTGDGHFIPLPVFGVAGFAVLYCASLLSRQLLLVAAGIGGAVALWLLYVQAFVVGAFCWLCVTTDVAAVVVALSAFMLTRQKSSADSALLLPAWTWWALAGLALGAPLVWPRVKVGPDVPRQVRALYRPGKLNVVEFADFQCPACRAFHGVLKPILQQRGDEVHFVRLNKPLENLHAFARDAARASVCGEAQGKRDEIADALFTTPDLSPEGIDAVAKHLELDLEKFEACMVAPETNARVDREAGLLVPPDLEGLPTTYIGGKRLVGVRSAAEVEDALERAARGEGKSGIAWYVYLPAVVLLGLSMLRLGLKSRRA